MVVPRRPRDTGDDCSPVSSRPCADLAGPRGSDSDRKVVLLKKFFLVSKITFMAYQIKLDVSF